MITFVYLGSKGGGLHFLQGLQSIATESKIDFQVIISNNTETTIEQANIIRLKKIPKNFLRLLLFFAFDLSRFLRHLSLILEESTYIFVMPHPLDFIIRKRVKKIGGQSITIIHDAKRHPREIFPNHFVNREIIKNSSRIITLSINSQQYVSGRFQTQSDLLPIIYPKIAISNTSEKIYDFAFVGRKSSYKGWNKIEEILRHIEVPFSCFIQGANEREIRRIAEKYRYGKFQGSKSWIPDQDFFNLIAQTKVIALPYTSASQSGLIPLAFQLGTNVVAYRIPGLYELGETSKYVTFVAPGDIRQFSSLLLDSISKPPPTIELSRDRMIWRTYLHHFPTKK